MKTLARTLSLNRRRMIAWLILILLVIAIQWISADSNRVERVYSRRIYPAISAFQRFLFGWIPFSVGDIFYFLLGLAALVWLIRGIRKALIGKLGWKAAGRSFHLVLFSLLLLYVLFYGTWGINYNRKGIADQIGLSMQTYSVGQLDSLTGDLLERVNSYSAGLDSSDRIWYQKKRNLKAESARAYEFAAKKWNFLQYRHRSLKPSMYSYLGNVLGFSGYYNPFSGEAQVNSTIPEFLQPFVACHEIGHQLGYAKENEANFAGYLSGKEHPSSFFRYSIYFNMFEYAYSELYSRDSAKAIRHREEMSPVLLADLKRLRNFYARYSNPVEPIITAMYGSYLKANNQPEGRKSYNRVVAFLIAYQRKYGREAL